MKYHIGQYHIGQMIKTYFDRLPRTYTVAWLAKQMNCDRTNIYNIFNRPSLDSHTLIRFSIILHHNFFKDIAEIIDRDLDE